MLIFVTGAAGFIGRSVVAELLAHDHRVLGLARNDANAQIISELGATPHRGDLTDLDSLSKGAAQADGVIHLAFEHDFSQFAECCRRDRAAIQAMAEAMQGTGKPLVITSGTLGLPKGAVATEDTEDEKDNPPFSDRSLSTLLVKKLSTELGIRGSIIKLAPTVHGPGDRGFVPAFVAGARKHGVTNYVGDGSTRWPAVHRDDAAVVFRLAVEKGRAGAVYFGVAEGAVVMKDIIDVIGQELKVPVEGVDREAVVQRLGFFGNVMAMDNPVSSQKTQEELGWKPVQKGLLEDMRANYFSPDTSSKYV